MAISRVTKFRKRLVASVFLVGVCTPVAASGDIIRYDTLGEWQAAVPNHVVDPFPGGPPYQFPTSGGSFDSTWLRIVIPANHGGISVGATFEGDVHRPGQGDPQFNRFEFMTPVMAVAFTLHDLESQEPLEVDLLGQSFLVYGQTAPRAGQGFFGVRSTEPFEFVEIRHPGVINNTEFYRVWDVYLQPVPEPLVVSLLVPIAAACALTKRTFPGRFEKPSSLRRA